MSPGNLSRETGAPLLAFTSWGIFYGVIMAKRFFDTRIWDEDWFAELPNKYKLFWFFILSRCDHAGIWKTNTWLFRGLIGESLDLTEALNVFNTDKNRIRILNNGNWFIEDFFYYQYGVILNLNNRVHLSIKKIWDELGVNVGSIRPQLEVKDGVKEQDIDKDRAKDTPIKVKGEDSKKEKFEPPTLDEVIEYFKENGYSKRGAEEAFKYYSEAEPPWTDSHGKPVRGWKQKMRGNQFREEYKNKEDLDENWVPAWQKGEKK